MLSALLARLGSVVALIYARLPKPVQDEITLYVTLAVVVINVVQVTLVSLPQAVTIAIAVVTVIAGAIGVRSSVTPLSKLPAPNRGPAPTPAAVSPTTKT